MKKRSVKIITLITAVLYCGICFGKANPPPPLPPPPGFPVDGGLVILFVLSLSLAFYKLIYTKKASK